MANERSQSSSEQGRGSQSVTQQQGQSRGLSRSYSPFGGIGGDLFSMSPFALLRAMTEEMDRAFSGGTPSAQRTSGGGSLASFIPPMEVREKDGNLVVCADLPGIDKNDVNIEVTDNELVIQGERRQEHEEGQGGWHRSERSYGRFYRAIPLPEGAQAEQAKAEFRNGVLEVKIPVQQPKSNRRQIQVQDASSTGSTTAQHTSQQSGGSTQQSQSK